MTKKLSNIDSLIKSYRQVFDGMIDHDKFNQIAMTFHSTAIEGSTLTLLDTEILLEKGISPGSKPIAEQHMVIDHDKALKFTLEKASKKEPLTIELIQSIAALVMSSTGGMNNTVMGNFDTSKGDFRRANNKAGSRYFVSYDKVIPLTNKLVKAINERMETCKAARDVLILSFQAHYDLISIHPFGDGNGRTSRLLMNYIQHYHGLPIAPVRATDRKAYILALEESRTTKKLNPFIDFMSAQYITFLKEDLQNYKTQQKIISKKPVHKKGNDSGYSLVF